MNKKLFHSDGNKFAEIEIDLNDGKLSICGTMGEVVSMKDAKSQALNYWKSFFEDSPSDIIDMNKRCGSKCHNALQAAKYVLSVDGDFHGLDVYKVEKNLVYISSSMGQNIDRIANEIPSFPFIETIVKIWQEWHLNDMKAGTMEQELALKEEAKKKGVPYLQYEESVEVLKNKGLYEVVLAGTNEKYVYGSAWLKRDLPSEVVQVLETL